MSRYCYGKWSGAKGVGYYTDNKPGLSKYGLVDENGNYPGTFSRSPKEVPVREPAGRQDLPDTITGLSDRLPKK